MENRKTGEFSFDSFTFTMEGGIISPSGRYAAIDAINGATGLYISTHETWEAIGYRWVVTGRALYTGTAPKRLAKYVWKTCKTRLSPEVVSQLGNLLQSHTGKDDGETSFEISFSRKAHARPIWGDSGSCLYSGCRPAAIPAFNADSRFRGVYVRKNGERWGRCWSILDGGRLFLFNAYSFGEFSALDFARLIAERNGLALRRCGIVNHGDDGGEIYVNDGRGWAVGAPERLEGLDSFDLDIDCAGGYRCDDCGAWIAEDDSHCVDGSVVCESCYCENYFYCDSCGESHQNDNYGGEGLCDGCFAEQFVACAHCSETTLRDDAVVSADGDPYCATCAGDYLTECAHCGELCNETTETNNGQVCAECLDGRYAECRDCETYHDSAQCRAGFGVVLCDDCLEAREAIAEESAN